MTKETLIQMSSQELDRVAVISKVISKSLKQSKAAELLDVSVRQVRRLVKKYRYDGPGGLASKKRGGSGRVGFSPELKSEVMSLINEHYHDFGPTLAAEKLLERHQININKETIRQWMIEHEVWQTKKRRKARIHQSRQRRSSRGEMVQIDGSHHDWFEGRASRCCLLVFIDDATSEIMQMRFEHSETTEGYFAAISEYLQKFGRPVTWYSDKDSIFRITHPVMADSVHGETQFQRAMKELDIGLICANSPQAKGRVERANNTLQDRLVKEMRLRGISSIETANDYLPEFIKAHNKRFAVKAASEIDAHRKVYQTTEELDLILCHQQTRKLSKNLELSYNNIIYQIQTPSHGYRLRHSAVTVCEKNGRVIHIIYKGKLLPFKQFEKPKYEKPAVAGNKEINGLVDSMLTADGRSNPTHKTIPPHCHPWRKFVISPRTHHQVRKQNRTLIYCSKEDI